MDSPQAAGQPIAALNALLAAHYGLIPPKLLNTYRFADHAEAVADLLARVCTVSVETMRIVDGLAAQSPLRPGA